RRTVPEASRTYVVATVAASSEGVPSASGVPSADRALSADSASSAAGPSSMTQPSGAAPLTAGAVPDAARGQAPAGSGSGGFAANGVIPAVAGPAEAEPSGSFTLALAGDVNFSERTADLLAAGAGTALHEAADQLSSADIAMVNLETAIT